MSPGKAGSALLLVKKRLLICLTNLMPPHFLCQWLLRHQPVRQFQSLNSLLLGSWEGLIYSKKEEQKNECPLPSSGHVYMWNSQLLQPSCRHERRSSKNGQESSDGGAEVSHSLNQPSIILCLGFLYFLSTSSCCVGQLSQGFLLLPARGKLRKSPYSKWTNKPQTECKQGENKIP